MISAMLKKNFKGSREKEKGWIGEYGWRAFWK